MECEHINILFILKTVIAGLFGSVVDPKVSKFPWKAKEDLFFSPIEMFIYQSDKNNFFILHIILFMTFCIAFVFWPSFCLLQFIDFYRSSGCGGDIKLFSVF